MPLDRPAATRAAQGRRDGRRIRGAFRGGCGRGARDHRVAMCVIMDKLSRSAAGRRRVVRRAERHGAGCASFRTRRRRAAGGRSRRGDGWSRRVRAGWRVARGGRRRRRRERRGRPTSRGGAVRWWLERAARSGCRSRGNLYKATSAGTRATPRRRGAARSRRSRAGGRRRNAPPRPAAGCRRRACSRPRRGGSRGRPRRTRTHTRRRVAARVTTARRVVEFYA